MSTAVRAKKERRWVTAYGKPSETGLASLERDDIMLMTVEARIVIIDALRSIIDLLKLKKDAKKVDLEIQRLSRENKQAESLLRIATMEEIEKYDQRVPRYRIPGESVIDGGVRKNSRPFLPAAVFWVLALAALALALALVFAVWTLFR